MTTIEEFFGSIGRRRPKAAVPPYPHANPDVSGEQTSQGRTRRFVVRVVLVLLLLLLVFFARFIPDTWNPFTATGLFASEGTANGSSGNGPAGALGATNTAAPQGESPRNGADGAPGSAGPRGADGASGANGLNGAPGAKGEIGATGATGPAGPMGPVGSLGQANSDISACDDNIVVGLRSEWSASDSSFHVSRVLLSDVSDACGGLYLGFDLLDSSGTSLAHIEVPSISVADGEVTLSAADYPSLSSVQSVVVARVALEIAS